MYVCSCTLPVLVTLRSQNRASDPWNWNYRWLWNTMKMLRIRPRCSAGAASAPSRWAISPASCKVIFMETLVLSRRQWKGFLPFKIWNSDTKSERLIQVKKSEISQSAYWSNKTNISCSILRPRVMYFTWIIWQVSISEGQHIAFLKLYHSLCPWATQC